MYAIDTVNPIIGAHTVYADSEAEAREIARLNPGSSWYRV